MDFAAPITWLINKVNSLVLVNADAMATAITNTITPVIALAFGIYLLLVSVNYLRGQETELVLDLGMRFISWGLIIGIGLNAKTYIAIVIPFVVGLPADLAAAFPGATFNANTLDTLALHYLKIIDDGFIAAAKGSWADMAGNYIVVAMKSVVVLLGLVPFLVFGTVILIIANVGLAIVAMIGPIFFGFLLFPATRQYFSAWVNTLFSYALIPLLVAIVASISLGLSAEIMKDTATGLLNASFKAVILASFGNLILLFLLKQVSSLASSLSAGGINASTGGGVGAAASAIRNSARGSSRDVKAMKQGAENIGKMASAINGKFNNIKPG
jgi:type IV secretion system protein VirB6